MSPFLRIYLKAKWSKLDSVEAIQIEVKKYLQDTLNKTTDGVTFPGLDKLDKTPPTYSCLTIAISQWIRFS